MARKLLAVFSMGLVSLAITGCASDQAIFRGQCPTGGCGAGMMAGGCNTGACMSGVGCQSGMCGPNGGMCPNGMCGPMAGGAGCQNGMCGPMAGGAGCQNGMCGRGGGHPYGTLNLPFHPVHRNYVDYQAPRNLQYPAPNQPNALVQYPYYTLRGPTDFFYDGK